MKRVKRPQPGRMTASTVASILAEIDAYERGERNKPLTWRALEEFSGFSHVSMWKRREVRDAFQAAKARMRADATPTVTPPRTTDERIVAMQAQIDALREIVRAYDEQWICYEYNAQRIGVDAEELRKPIVAVQRVPVRSPRLKALN